MGKLTDAELAVLVTSFDVVGDIAILRIPVRLASWKRVIAETVLERIRHVKAVLNQTGPVIGEYRLRDLEWIGGEHKTETIYREAGCVFRVDMATVYVSPRLSYERMRIGRLVGAGEVVVNMFAGIGSFSILIAKHRSPVRVYSVDLNPRAINLMKANIILNRVQGIVYAIEGDAQNIVETRLRSVADRVLMPLPEKAFEYLGTAVNALKPSGGTIHYYDFTHCKKTEDPRFKVEKKVMSKLHQMTTEHSVEFSRVVRSVGPNWYQVVLDIHAVPLPNKATEVVDSVART